jgi:hypothetical protein
MFNKYSIFLLMTLIAFTCMVVNADTYLRPPALIEGYTTTAKASGTTTLTRASQTQQSFTGTGVQTVVLPDATTLDVGQKFYIYNVGASGLVTVQDGALGALGTIPGTYSRIYSLRAKASAAGTWDVITMSVDGFTSGSVLFAGTEGQITQDNTNFFWDDTNNRFGIGGGAADNTISLGGSSYGMLFHASAEGGTDLAEFGLHRHSATAGFGPFLVGVRSRGTEASETVVSSGDTLFRLIGTGHDGTDYEQAAAITMAVDGTPGAGDMPGRITFSTSADGAATPTERMRIDSAGNVGIGINNPVDSLHIEKTASNSLQIPIRLRNLDNTNGGTATSIGFRTGTTNSGYKGILAYERTASFGVGKMHILMNSTADTSDATLAQAKFTVDSAGQVGIGTTSPSSILHTIISDSATSTVSNALTIGHDSSGTPAANFGTSFIMQADSDTQEDRQLFKLNSYWTTATDATRSSRTELYGTLAGAETKFMEFGRGGGRIVEVTGTSSSTSITGGTSHFNVVNVDATGSNTSKMTFFSENTGNAAWIASQDNNLHLGTGNSALTVLSLQETTGNVGIGDTTPDARLDIVGATDDQQLLVVGNGTQTVNIVEVLDSALASLFAIDPDGDVGIGDTTPDGRLDVQGNADEIQLRVAGNATQTSNTLLVENSGGTDLFSVDNSGNGYFSGYLNIGSAGAVYPLYLIDTNGTATGITARISTAKTDAAASSMSITNIGTKTTTAAANVYGPEIYVAPRVASGITNSGNAAGLIVVTERERTVAGDVPSADSGTLTAIYGMSMLYGHNNDDSAGSNPLTTNAYGLHIVPSYQDGTVTNMYDIYLASPNTGGTATNQYGIYQQNTKENYFSGVITANAGVKVSNTDPGDSTLSHFESGSFTSTVTGYSSGDTTKTLYYQRTGNQVTLTVPAITGTSNATTFRLSLPAHLQSTLTATADQRFVIPSCTDNGSTVYSCLAFIPATYIDLRDTLGGSTWTASGTKSVDSFVITYLIQ